MKDNRGHILCVPMREDFRNHSFLAEVYSAILPSRGWKVTWYLEDLAPGEGAKESEWNGARVLSFPRLPDRRNSLKSPFSGKYPLRELLKTGEYDILQIRNYWRAAQACRKTCRESGIPLVFQRSFPRENYFIQDVAARNISLKTLRRIKLRMEKKSAYREIGLCDWIFPISDSMKEEMAAAGLPPEKMTPVPLGFNCGLKPGDVDGDPIRKELGLEDRPAALYFGSMEPQRRLDVTLRAFAAAAKEVPGVALLMLGGDGSPESKKELETQAEQLGLQGKTIFLKQVPREAVFRYIRAADFTLSIIPDTPSYRVSSPTKVAESLGMGKPVLVSELPEQARMIRESGAGLRVPFDETAAAAAMARLFRDREGCAKMGTRGRAYMEQHRDYNKIADTIETIYDNLRHVKK